MNAPGIIDYFFESGICLALMYLFYQTLLRNEKMFLFNRIYLAGSLVFSTLLPFLDIPFRYGAGSSSVLADMTRWLGSPAMLPTVVITAEPGSADLTGSLWVSVLQYAYMIGAAFLLVRFVTGLTGLFRMVRRNEISKLGDRSVVYIKQDLAPFSFFGYIFLNPSRVGPGQVDRIIRHESAHGKQLHTVDLMLTEVLTALTWMNPAVWLVRSALKENHEFAADRSATKEDRDVSAYQTLLLHLGGGRYAYGMTNHFNQSIIKKRIIMITKNRPTKLAMTRALLFVPLLAMNVWLFASSHEEGKVSLQKESAVESSSVPRPGVIADTIIKQTQDEEIFYIVEVMPRFNGLDKKESLQAFKKYIAEHVQYPEICKEKKIQGKVEVQFIVRSDGRVSDARIESGVDPALDKEALRVVMTSPDWTPGMQSGKKVDVYLTVPIEFKLQ